MAAMPGRNFSASQPMLTDLLIFLAGIVCGMGGMAVWFGLRFLADLRAAQHAAAADLLPGFSLHDRRGRISAQRRLPSIVATFRASPPQGGPSFSKTLTKPIFITEREWLNRRKPSWPW